METGHHIVSVDLGFAGEPTALAVVKPVTSYYYDTGAEDSLASTNSFDVLHLERFEPGAGYSNVAAWRHVRKRSSRIVAAFVTQQCW